MDLRQINKAIGGRLKAVRKIFNEGGSLSGEQFAFLFDETRSVIANYESGRTPIPADLLWRLYDRGYSPTFIISGSGSIFADNEAGRLAKSKVESKKTFRPDVAYILDYDELEALEVPVINAAAGRLPNNRVTKREGET